MKLVSSQLELRVIRTLASTKSQKESAKLFSSISEDCFYSKAGRECYSRIFTLMRERGQLVGWGELKVDPVLSENVREKLKNFTEKAIPYDAVSKAIKILHKYRRMRIMLELSQNIVKELNKKKVDVDVLEDTVAKKMLQSRSGQDVDDWFIHVGAKDKSDIKAVEKLLEYDPKRFIPTGIKAHDDINLGIPRGSFWLLGGNTGSGKCLVGTSLVPTSKGIFTLKQLYDMKGLKIKGTDFFELPKDIKVITHKDEKKTAVSIHKTSGPTWKIKTGTGDYVEGLVDHKLYVLTQKGTLEFKKLNEISVGDWLPKAKTDLFTKKVPDLKVTLPSNKEHNGNVVHIIDKVPELTIEFAEFLGLVVAEGKRNISLTMWDKDVQKRIINTLQSTFGLTWEFYGKGVINFGYYLGKILLQITGDVTSSDRYVPDVIMRSPDYIQGAFLRGYFEGDGCIYGKNVANLECASISRTLIYQLKAMLENLGLSPNVNFSYKHASNTEAKRKVPTWNLHLFRYELQEFKERVGFISKRKRQALDRFIIHQAKDKIQNTNPKATGWINYLPVTNLINDLVTALNEWIKGKTVSITACHNQSKNLITYTKPMSLKQVLPCYTTVLRRHLEKNNAHLSKYLINQILDFINTSPYKHELIKDKSIKDVLDKIEMLKDYKWTQVTSSKDSKRTREVYDLFVKDHHSYCVNGIVSHNSVMTGQLAHNMARSGAKVCIVPLEMKNEEMLQREVSRLSLIDMQRLNDPRLLSKLEKQNIISRYERFRDKIVRIGGQLSLFSPEEDMTAEEVLFALLPFDFDVVFIDYIGLLKGVDGDDQWRAMRNVTRFCKRFASINNMVINVSAQLSDEGIIRYAKGMVEDASNAWFFQATATSRETGVMWVDQPKARSQKKFKFPIHMNYEVMTVSDITDEQRENLEDKKEKKNNKEQKGFTKAKPSTNKKSFEFED